MATNIALRALPRMLALPLLIVTALFVIAAPASADSTGEGQVSATQVAVGTPVLFSGTGFEPGTEVVCYHDDVEVSRVPVDDSGRFQFNMKNTRVGDNEYRGEGGDPAGGTRVVNASVVVVAAGEQQGGVGSIPSGSGGLGADRDGLATVPVLLGFASVLLLGVATRLLLVRG